jgi:hypothetical protein
VFALDVKADGVKKRHRYRPRVKPRASNREYQTNSPIPSPVAASRHVESGAPIPSNEEGPRSPPILATQSGSLPHSPAPAQAEDRPPVLQSSQQAVPSSNSSTSEGAGPFGSTPLTAGAGVSGRKVPIRSLRDDLLGCPLEAIFAILPEDFVQDAGRTTPERFADLIVHHQFSVRFVLFLSYFYFFFFTNIFLDVLVHSQIGRSVPELPKSHEHFSTGGGRYAGQNPKP